MDTKLSFSEINVTKRLLGSGQAASVYVGIHTLTGTLYAVKISDDTKGHSLVKNELDILSTISHPFIVELCAYTDDLKSVSIVITYANGGDLNTYFTSYRRANKRKIPLATVKNAFKTVSNAVGYLHSQGIAHQDIKLENILLLFNDLPTAPSKEQILSYPSFNIKFMLADFGFAKKVDPKVDYLDVKGTPYYLPPEAVNPRPYDPFKLDMWSLGVFTYYLIYGEFPFDSIDGSMRELFYAIECQPLELGPQWRDACEWIPTSTCRLLHGLLAKPPQYRMTAAEVLKDEWFPLV